MSVFKTLVSLALLVSTRLALVQAAVYVTNPVQSTVCNGGQSCQVEWVDDGQSPLLSDIGECTVGLYNGEMLLVQSLSSVNVADTHSFSFTPSPSAGDNGGYYLVFTSTSTSYQGWSGTFTLNGMTGSSGSGSSTVVGSSTLGGSSTGSTASLGSSTSVANSTSTGGTSTGSVPTSTVVASSFTSPSTVPSATPTSPTGTSSLSAPSTVSSGTSSHSSSASSATPSASQSGAAIRSGASTSLAGGLILALAGALAF